MLGYNSSMKKGFTLVELSIVLVIVGLLTAGIMVGQSLIESSRIARTVKEIQQIEITMEQFQSKFRGLPGDSKIFGGNGDGRIDSVLFTVGGAGNGEDFAMWKNLYDTGFWKDGYEAASGPTGLHGDAPGGDDNRETTTGVNIPISASDAAAGIYIGWWGPNWDLAGEDWDDRRIRDGFNNHFAFVGKDSGYTNGRENFDKIHKVSFLASVDKKMDDALPGQGDIMTMPRKQSWHNPECVTTDNSTTARYETSDIDEDICTLLVHFNF